jgi:hypothetical protein
VIAGVSVAFVLIPQALAYAQLAGMPPQHGLYAAILPPIAAAFFASSPYLQTGPATVSSLLTLGALSVLAVPETPRYVQLAAVLAIVVGRVTPGSCGVVATSCPARNRRIHERRRDPDHRLQVPTALGVTGFEGGSSGALTVAHPEVWSRGPLD